jgi:hypothetical protein
MFRSVFCSLSRFRARRQLGLCPRIVRALMRTAASAQPAESARTSQARSDGHRRGRSRIGDLSQSRVSEWRTQVGRGRRHLAPRPVRAPSTWAHRGCRAHTRRDLEHHPARTFTGSRTSSTLTHATGFGVHFAARREDGDAPAGAACDLFFSAISVIDSLHRAAEASTMRLPARLLVARQAPTDVTRCQREAGAYISPSEMRVVETGSGPLSVRSTVGAAPFVRTR